MIISASYRTDIPTFYGKWFVNRLKAGYCLVPNPYNKTAYRVPLDGPEIDGYVFWTKNLAPFFAALDEVENRGFPFTVQYTITGYPRVLEQRVTSAANSISHIRKVVQRFGHGHVVWRYDPIVISSVTPEQFHLENFQKLAQALEGSVDEVVISFVQLYKKTLRNFAMASVSKGLEWADPDDEWKRKFAAQLAHIATQYSIRAAICSQPTLTGSEVGEARCVDALRLSNFSENRVNPPIKGNRPGCGCYASRDIGTYDTCPHGCIYCYAVTNRQLARRRYGSHNPEAEMLFEPVGGIDNVVDIANIPNVRSSPLQLRLSV